jgi:nicotinate-nucleotide adenylyltransferase
LLIAKESYEIKQPSIGIYLGSFDPVHNAHIDIPLKIKNHFELDKIIYVPTGTSPVGKAFKANKSDRLKMLENVIAQDKSLSIDDYELKSSDISYSFNTLKYFEELYPQNKLRLIIGEDNFMSFTKWYKYYEIMKVVNIVVLVRDNILRCDNMENIKTLFEENINLFNKAKFGKIYFSEKYKSNISSTMVREHVNRNESIVNYVSNENNKYILDKGLYR